MIGLGHMRDEARLPQHVAFDRMPFIVVRVEQTVRRRAFQNARDLPAEIERFLNARVHPLRAGRAVYVSRIAGKEDAAYTQPIHHSAVQMKIRRPCQVRHVDAFPHAPGDQRLAFFERRRRDLVERRLAEHRGRGRRRDRGRFDRMVRNQTMTAMTHRKQRDETLARREDMEFVLGPIGFGMHIGQQERLLEGAARKAQTEPMANRAMRAVSRDHVRRAQSLGMAVRAAQRHLNAGGTLHEHHQLNAAFDCHAERREMLRQQTFGHRLIEKKQIRIARAQRIEIEARETHAIGKKIGDACAMTEVEKRLDQAMLFKQFERARLNADGP
ncbi:hypothetical protein R75465_07103 [Paraburkholderia aspalathi]|nr:hypothetical protein R75465_07103 [Paraburkholderia aspalathi]